MQRSRMRLASNGKPASETGKTPVACRRASTETTARWSSLRNTSAPFSGSRTRPRQTHTGEGMEDAKIHQFIEFIEIIRGSS
jgi:hypothetical protein